MVQVLYVNMLCQFVNVNDILNKCATYILQNKRINLPAIMVQQNKRTEFSVGQCHVCTACDTRTDFKPSHHCVRVSQTLS